MKKKIHFCFGLVLLAVFLAAPIAARAQDAQGAQLAGPQELDQMLAPIALYPDSLLSQVLMASTYPLEVVEADRWVKGNRGLKGQQLDDAVQNQDWDVSIKSLVYFPDVLAMMSEKLDWTSRLGDTFLAQEKDVMDTVQRLRAKAKAAGNLKTTKQQKVVVEQQYIEIQPADPQVVYVPVYNPTVVYGPWWYPAYPPYAYYPPGYVATAGAIGFTAGFFAGAACFGAFNWGGGNVYINNNNFYHRNNWNNPHDHRLYDQHGNWQHNPYHRQGQMYKNPNTAKQFGQKPGRSADAGKNIPKSLSGEGKQNFRGHDTDSGMQNRSQPAAKKGGYGQGSSQQDHAFGNYGSGKNELAASQRGQASRSSERYQREFQPQGRGGGGSYGGGGGSRSGGGGSFRGGGGGGHRR